MNRKQRLIALAMVLAFAGTAVTKNGQPDWAMKMARRQRRRHRIGRAVRLLGGRR